MSKRRVKPLSECTNYDLLAELRARFPAMIFIGLEQLDGNQLETVFKTKGSPEVLQVLSEGYQTRATALIRERNKPLHANEKGSGGNDGGSGEVLGSIQM